MMVLEYRVIIVEYSQVMLHIDQELVGTCRMTYVVDSSSYQSGEYLEVSEHSFQGFGFEEVVCS